MSDGEQPGSTPDPDPSPFDPATESGSGQDGDTPQR